MKTLFCITIFFFMLGSCNKDNVKTVVNGTVINAADKKEISNIEVRLIEGFGFASNTGSKTIESTITDNNGDFNFNFIATPSRWYSVTVSNLDIFLTPTTHGFKLTADINKGKVNDIILTPMKFAYSKMIIDGSEGADSIRLQSSHEFVETFGGDRVYYAGDFFESSMSKGLSGKIFYKIIRFTGGVETIEYDTINRVPYQEHLIEIKF